MNAWRLTAASLALVFLARPAVHGQAPTLDILLTRLEAYLTDYEQQMSAVVADEQYDQSYQRMLAPPNWTTTKRALKSEFVFLTVPGDRAWMGFRDTYTVDGKAVRDRDARLQSLLATNRSDALRQASQISETNARFNLGDFPRSINVPTMALGLIHPKNRERFKTRVAGREKVDGGELWMLEYRESGRPTIIRTLDGRDQPSKVTVSVDAASGAVYKTVLDIEGGRTADKVETQITVNYEPDVHAAALVPRTMVESYWKRADRDSYGFTIIAVAAYSNYRRFQTSGRIIQ